MINQYVLRLLNLIQAEDAESQKAMIAEHGAATFCSECKKNTHVGQFPFWHRFSRRLCDDCARTYVAFLRKVTDLDDLTKGQKESEE